METITRDENSGSLTTFCAGPQSDRTGYEHCPIWRRNKRETWKRKAKELEAELAAAAPRDPRPS